MKASRTTTIKAPKVAKPKPIKVKAIAPIKAGAKLPGAYKPIKVS
jgi:hypothetical protein